MAARSDLIRPGREITGIAAVLLPYLDGRIDWASYDRMLTATVEAGLTPAVNMDTGYVNLLTPAERRAVLDRARSTLGGTPFVAGAFVDQAADDPRLATDGYRAAIAEVVAHGGTPVVFPSPGLSAVPEPEVAAALRSLTVDCDRFIAFELGPMFVPFGRIWSLDTYAEVVAIESCIGAKHSSLDRSLEWDRLAVRDRVRPEFHVFTGNDLAIDLVMWGSDYLLGLAAFAPHRFAARDAAWAFGDERFFAMNDALQALGSFAFRAPVPAYKHDAAMCLAHQGLIATGETHPLAPARPASDADVLAALLARVDEVFDA